MILNKKCDRKIACYKLDLKLKSSYWNLWMKNFIRKYNIYVDRKDTDKILN